MEHVKKLYISKEALAKYKSLLTTEPKSSDECMGEDETISRTVRFDDGAEMDIKICGVQFREGESNLPWTEAVLFKNGCEVGCTDVSDEYEGEWSIEDDGNTYTVYVEAQPRTVKYYCNCCGEEFTAEDDEIVCPSCGCEYSEKNDYIERFEEDQACATQS